MNTAAFQASTQPTATIANLAIASLRESPFNPRKFFDPAALAELSISIASQGILQPLVVRPVVDHDIRHSHELVFGHRRLRAGELAGLTHVPCLVTAMTDTEAALAQVHENGQRQDISALEEADSYINLRDWHGLDVASIVASIGKSQSHVYGRLKLATLSTAVRTAMTDAALPAEIAVELARVKSHAEQGVILAMLRDDDGWLSTRDAKDLIRRRWRNDTGLVYWDPTDPNLISDAGACTDCPHRAGNDPDLADIVAPGVCTHAVCFVAKQTAWQSSEAETLRKNGQRSDVVTVTGAGDGDPTSEALHTGNTGNTNNTDRSGWSLEECFAADPQTWQRVRRAMVLHTLRTPRTAADLHLIAHELFFVSACQYLKPTDLVFDVLGFPSACKFAAAAAGENFHAMTWFKETVHAMPVDDLAGLMVAAVMDENLNLSPHEYSDQARVAKAVAWVKSRGLDIVAVVTADASPAAAQEPTDAVRDPNTADMFDSAPCPIS